MRWVCRGFLGRGENPDFMTFRVLADVENRELPWQFLRLASPYFSASRHPFWHGFSSHTPESIGNYGPDHVCCEMLRPPNMYPPDRGFMDSGKSPDHQLPHMVTPSEPLGPRYPTGWSLSSQQPWAPLRAPDTRP